MRKKKPMVQAITRRPERTVDEAIQILWKVIDEAKMHAGTHPPQILAPPQAATTTNSSPSPSPATPAKKKNEQANLHQHGKHPQYAHTFTFTIIFCQSAPPLFQRYLFRF